MTNPFLIELFKSRILIALSTQTIFLLGEMGASNNLLQHGTEVSFFKGWFLVFCLTRVIGIVGQIYLWAYAPLGITSILMSSSGIFLSILFSCLNHQMRFTTNIFLSLSFVTLAMVLSSQQ